MKNVTWYATTLIKYDHWQLWKSIHLLALRKLLLVFWLFTGSVVWLGSSTGSLCNSDAHKCTRSVHKTRAGVHSLSALQLRLFTLDDCPARQVPSTVAGSPTHQAWQAWAEDRRQKTSDCWRLCLASVNNKRPHLVFGKLARSLKTIAWPLATPIDIGGLSVSQFVCQSVLGLSQWPPWRKNAIENKQVEVARSSCNQASGAQAAHKMPMPRKHLPLSGESVWS